MGILINERPDSRNGTPEQVNYRYTVTGTGDRFAVEATVLSGSPPVIVTLSGVLYRQSRDISIEFTSGNYAVATVPYTKDKDNEAGSYSLSFDTTGGTIHITNSKETVRRFGNAPDHMGAIGVHGDEVDGVDVVMPALKLVVTFRHPSATLNLDRVRTFARNTGKTNSAPFMTFAAGEVLYLGSTGSEGSEAEAEVSHHFACSENAEGLTIGEIANVAKKGHEYLWIAYKDAVENGRPAKQPDGVYVERIYEETDLVSVVGFG